MQVGMTFRAARGRRREYQAGVATLASDPLVQALQRKTRLPVMIELRLLPDRFPGGARVAVFASVFSAPREFPDQPVSHSQGNPVSVGATWFLLRQSTPAIRRPLKGDSRLLISYDKSGIRCAKIPHCFKICVNLSPADGKLFTLGQHHGWLMPLTDGKMHIPEACLCTP